MTQQPAVQFTDITKAFSGNVVLNKVSFSIQPGEVHALIGENGAGKSTLLNILHGVYQEFDGTVEINGEAVHFKNAHEAILHGISKVHQEVSVIPELTVGQNVALGYEPRKGLLIDYPTLYRQTQEILDKLGCKFTSESNAGRLSTGEIQMMAIAKALFHHAKIISFDEPTASLSENETKILFDVIADLKSQGITIIYVSHRLEEIFKITDRVTVLRDGQYINTFNTKEISRNQLIQNMVGRDISGFAVRLKPNCMQDQVVLSAKNLTRAGVFQNVSFDLRRGEILGFAGLVGSKRTDVVRTLFGADPLTSGEIMIRDKKVTIRSPQEGLEHGIALIPENRKTQGFVKVMNNADNAGLASMDRFTKRGIVNHKKKRDHFIEYMDLINLNPKDPDYLTERLSGGNQQKVILIKWLSTNADILIFDEPTKGIDVGAKVEIYRIMEDLVEQGKSIIMVSSELPEVLGISDRILIMREGRLVAEIPKLDYSEEKVMHYAMGGN